MVVLLQQLERPVLGLDAHVVGLHDHPAPDHQPDQVLAAAGEPAGIAMRPRWVRGYRRNLVAGEGEHSVADDVELPRHRVGLRVVVLLPLAGLGVPEAAGRVEVAGVHSRAGGARVEARAAQAVVELVHREQRPDAEVVEAVQLRPDVLARAVRARPQPAAEQLRGLHAHDHGDLPVVDHAARLERVLDDPEPALARPALLRVDVVLELVHAPKLEAGASHLVAALALAAGEVVGRRVELAERAVLHQVVDDQAQAAPPRALQPLVVGLLVRQGVVVGPVAEGRPPGGVVGRRRFAAQSVLEHRGRAVRLVVGAVHEGVRHPVAVPRPAAVRAAEELEGTEVEMRVEQALDAGERGLAFEGLAGGAHPGLRVATAPARAFEVEAGPIAGEAGTLENQLAAGRGDREHVSIGPQREREGSIAGGLEAPVRRAARLLRGLGLVRERSRGVREELAALVVEEVLAEVRRLHAKALGAGPAGGGGPIALAVSGDELAECLGTEGEAPARDGVAGLLRVGSGRRRPERRQDGRGAQQRPHPPTRPYCPRPSGHGPPRLPGAILCPAVIRRAGRR
jgi:hypothetical protein